VARWQRRRVFAFTRAGDRKGQDFARALGAEWAGSSEEMPPEALDAAIIYAPVGALVPLALKAVRKGGRVVCADIHMSDIPPFPMIFSGKNVSWYPSPTSPAKMRWTFSA
jgi:propanol-preferring alcohol dehydrogenase